MKLVAVQLVLIAALILTLNITLTLGQNDVTLLENEEEDDNIIEKDASIVEEETETTTTTTTVTTTTTTTTTTTALPIGQTKRLTVNNLTPGLSVQMDFKQGNDGVYIHAAVSSSGESLYRICLPEHENRPKIYMVEGFSDCSAITSQETVNAKLIATLDNPNEDTTQLTIIRNINELNGNCIAILQDRRANSRLNEFIDTEEEEEENAEDASSRQDDGDALTIGEEILQTTRSTTTVETTTTTATTTPATLPNGCPLGSSARKGRLNVETISRRTFSSISLGSVLVLSTATTYVAPTIVNSNVGSGTINFGSVQVHTWSPWDTMPFLQLPGWTVATVYTIILGLFVLYFANIIGSFIPGFSTVSNIASRIIDTNPTTRKLSTFFSYLENKSTSGITNLVHDSLRRFRRFRRRNYNPPRHATKYFKNSKPRPSLMNYENYDDYIIDDYDY